MGQTIKLTGEQLTLEQVVEVAYEDTLTVCVAASAKPKIQASRQVIEDVLSQGHSVYGVNTGFGALSNVSISPEQLDQLQANLVRSHSAGTGDPLPIPVVRAMMLLRANTLVKGFSGVRPVVIETLLAMLNKGVYPVVPSKGSLGASGDLAPLAHLSLVLMGEGEAWYQGQRLSGQAALEKAGIFPVTLKAKEGLALLNGTQMMTALGILTLHQAEALVDIADLAGAMTIEAVKGSHKPFDPRIAEVRPHPGHGASSALIRTLLEESEIEVSHQNCSKVQDAYSLRCIPQVHGMVRDTLTSVRRTLEIEANAATDNPLVFPDGAIISQGNFHGEPVAMALDQLGIALAELASISERRIDKLMNPVFSGLPAFLVGDHHAGLNSGLMIVHYTAASLVSENKILAHPAVVDTIPTSNDKEDHVSMGATAARKAEQILKHTTWVLAAELFAAAQGLEFHNGLRPGQGVRRAYERIRQVVPPVTQDRVFAGDIENVVGLIRNGALTQVIQEACGGK